MKSAALGSITCAALLAALTLALAACDDDYPRGHASGDGSTDPMPSDDVDVAPDADVAPGDATPSIEERLACQNGPEPCPSPTTPGIVCCPVTEPNGCGCFPLGGNSADVTPCGAAWCDLIPDGTLQFDEYGCVVWVPSDPGASCLDNWDEELDAGDAGDANDAPDVPADLDVPSG